MSNKMFMRVEDVAEEMGVSVSYASTLKINEFLEVKQNGKHNF